MGSNLREIGEILLDLLHFKDMAYKCIVTNKVMNVASDNESLYQFLKQLGNYLWVFCILTIGGPLWGAVCQTVDIL